MLVAEYGALLAYASTAGQFSHDGLLCVLIGLPFLVAKCVQREMAYRNTLILVSMLMSSGVGAYVLTLAVAAPDISVDAVLAFQVMATTLLHYEIQPDIECVTRECVSPTTDNEVEDDESSQNECPNPLCTPAQDAPLIPIVPTSVDAVVQIEAVNGGVD
jgi:hypothetical protein